MVTLTHPSRPQDQMISEYKFQIYIEVLKGSNSYNIIHAKEINKDM